MANIKDLIQSIEAADSSFDEKLAAINQMEETLVAMRAQEEQAVQDNVDLIVEAIKVMEKKVSDQLEVAKSIVPEKGDKGDKGDKGLDGKIGRDGKDGRDGLNGKDGIDGSDGVSVTDAKIDFDGSLVITLSTGRELNVGEVVAPDLQEKIKLVTSGGAGTVLPSQTGNANKYLKTDGTALSWAVGDGTGTVTSVGGTGTVSGISLSGTVTTSGNLTLGGALDLSSPPAIGSTTPAAGTFTTLTAQTEVLKGTGQNYFTNSNNFSTGWSPTNATVSTASAITDPFGGTSTWNLTEDSTTNSHYITKAFTAFIGASYTLSMYAKANTRNFIVLQMFDNSNRRAWFNLSTGTVGTTDSGVTAAIQSIGNGWYRCSILTNPAVASTFPTFATANADNSYIYLGNGSGIYIYGAQLELSTTLGAYTSTTTTAIFNSPNLSFASASSIGLQSDGSLYVQPAGTGALQAQATTSSATGGNARGANAVDWQTSRGSGGQVASGSYGVIAGGVNNTVTGFGGVIGGGSTNQANTNIYTVIGGGLSNTVTGERSFVGGGSANTAAGYLNFIGAGFTNSGTSGSAVTTQSGTMNATTAVTLSGSNASIKVGQYITGTSIAANTYVAAISGTSLTLSQVASGSSTSTLTFWTPHGVVVGGGNNQATGSYSFIGGGGDAGTAANRNTASGAWSAVLGGARNVASGDYAVVAGGGAFAANTASGTSAFVAGGWGNQASNQGATTVGGNNNFATGVNSASFGGAYGTARGITGISVFPSSNQPISGGTSGIVQASLLVLARQTTDATATVITSDANAASGTNQVILPNNSAYFFTGEVIAGVTGGGNTKGWSVEGVIKRGAGVGTTALVGTPTVTSLYADAGAATWALTATADVTNGGLAITFTGQAATTIRVVAQIRTTEMTY